MAPGQPPGIPSPYPPLAWPGFVHPSAVPDASGRTTRAFFLGFHVVGAALIGLGAMVLFGIGWWGTPTDLGSAMTITALALAMAPLPVLRGAMRYACAGRTSAGQLRAASQAATLLVASLCFAFFAFMVWRASVSPIPADVIGLWAALFAVMIGIAAALGLVPGILLLLEWRDDRRERVSLARETVISVFLFLGQLGSAAMLAMAAFPD